MKNKLKQWFALIGTALLSNPATVGATAAINSTAENGLHHTGNDSLFSKLGTAAQPPKPRRGTRDSKDVAFSREQYQVDEGNFYGATITLVRQTCHENSSAVSVSYASSNGTATESDYHPVSGTLNFSSADASGNCGARDFYVQLNDDELVEGDETVHLKLTDPTSGAEIDQATLTITDNDGSKISFSQENYLINEGEQSVTVTLERACVNDATPTASVRYNVSQSDDSTATNGKDYQAVTGNTFRGGQIQWQAGECGQKSFEIAIVDDSQKEGDETVHLELISASQATLDKSSAVLTIIDNDGNTQSTTNNIRFSKSQYTVDEGNFFGSTITVVRPGCDHNSPPMSVSYTTVEGTADESDYTPVSGSMLFSSADASGTCGARDFYVQLNDDELAEGDETLDLLLTDPATGAEIGKATLTIIDNDSSVIGFAQDNYSAKESDQVATITVERTQCAGEGASPASVRYKAQETDQNTATAGADSDGETSGLSRGGTLQWAEGECGPKTFEVPIVKDAEVEEDETVHLELISATQAGLGKKLAVLTIINTSDTDSDSETDTGTDSGSQTVTPSRIAFTQNHYRVDENNPNGVIRINVERTPCDPNSTSTLLVSYASSDETALSNEDYKAVSGQLSFTSGPTAGSSGMPYCEKSDYFEIPIIDDNLPEGDETFQLKLSDPVGAQLGKSEVTVTIIDDEGPSAGKAIIVAGVSESEDSLSPYSLEYTQRMYTLLQERGFAEKDIKLIQPPFPNEALPDLFKGHFSTEEWGDFFVLYWHGHALPDHLIPNNETLSALQLSQLLDPIPAEVTQVIILDTCYSGSFLDELKGVPNRIVLTSTNDLDTAWKMRDGRSFSDQLIRELRRGETLGNAFFNIQETIAADPKWFRNQEPGLDDNSDGQYTAEDGDLAVETYLGREGIHAAPPPEIVDVHPPISLTGETALATLWVKIIPDREEAIRQVRAILINPDLPQIDYEGETTDFGRTELKLRYNPSEERYESDSVHFCTSGQWRVTYQVESQEGIWSDIQIGEVQQTSNSQAAACLIPLTVKLDLKQRRYTGGDTLPLKMTVEGVGEADLYVAMTTPAGYFITLAYPEKWSALNTAQAYLSGIQSADSSLEYPLNLSIPAGLVFGHYSACGILVLPNAEALNQSHWIHKDCTSFEIYDNTQVPTDLSTFRDTLQDGSLGPEMVWIPAGTFRMGNIQSSGGSSSEKPVHEVSVARFAIGRYEVTHVEFVHFLNTVKRRGPEAEPWFATKAEYSDSHITGSTGNFIVEAGYENHPVIEVSWYGATAYLNWLTEQTGKPYRLPTEAQWEYAARAGTETRYWWGNDFGKNRANCGSNGLGETAPVGSFEANPFGLYDTVGNVWEWCADPWHDNYQNAPTDGRIWEKQGDNRRLLRGGSFIDIPLVCRAAYRDRYSSDFQSWDGGFRGCADIAL